jgi:hypothetical protein
MRTITTMPDAAVSPARAEMATLMSNAGVG